MGFIDDKNNIVQQVGLFEVLGDLPNNKLISNIESVKSSSKNLMPFLLDLLSIACKDKKNLSNIRDRAKCDLIRIFTEILVDFFPIFMRILKEAIIKGIKAGLLCPADFKIPNIPLTVELKPNEFDFNKLTTLDTNAFPASLFFGDPDKDLNVFLANLIQGGVGNTGIWKNILDFEVVEYNINNGLTTVTDVGLKVTINSSYSGKEFDTFLKDFMNGIEIFSADNFIPNLMEQFNGSISSLLNNVDASLGLDIESATAKEKTDKMVEKILDTDPCEITYNLNDSFFEFDSDELLSIEKNAQNRVNGGKILDYSCEPLLVSTPNSINEDNINGIREAINNNPNSAKFVMRDYTQTVLNDLSGGDVIGFGDDVKKSLSFELSLALPKLGTNVIFMPKIMVLYQIAKKLVTNDVADYNTSFDFAKANRVFFEYVVRESGAALLKIIFDQIKEEILKIVGDLVAQLVAEAASKRINQLRSLTGRFDIKSGLSAINVPDVSNLF
jgi:hypothetical protein